MKQNLPAAKTILHPLLAALLALCVVAAADDKDKDKDKGDDKAALQGTWAPVSSESGGNPDAEDEYKQYRLTFDGDGYTVRRSGDVAIKGTFTLDGAQTPKRIDMLIAECENEADKGKTLKGIYEVKGEDLKWCFAPPDAGERPTEFATKAGSDHIFATFKREKK